MSSIISASTFIFSMCACVCERRQQNGYSNQSMTSPCIWHASQKQICSCCKTHVDDVMLQLEGPIVKSTYILLTASRRQANKTQLKMLDRLTVKKTEASLD